MKAQSITAANGRKYLVIKPDNWTADKPYDTIHFGHGDDIDIWKGNEAKMISQALPKFVSGQEITGDFVLIAPYGNGNWWPQNIQADKDWIESNFKIGERYIAAGYSAGAGEFLNSLSQGWLTGKAYTGIVAFSGYLPSYDNESLVRLKIPVKLWYGKSDDNWAVKPSMANVAAYFSGKKTNVEVNAVDGDHGSVAANVDYWKKALLSVGIVLGAVKPSKPVIPQYEGFRFGANFSYKNETEKKVWNDYKQADLMASIGANSARQTVWIGNLQPWFFDQLKYAAGKGITDTALTIDFDVQDFDGYDKPALINGKVNPENPVAVAVKTVIDNAPSVKFLTIVNELDLIKGSWTIAQNWLKADPKASELQNWTSTIQQYIQCLKAAYEVVSTFRPDLFLCSGISNHPEFHEAFIRNGGANYVTCIDMHSYPVYAAANAKDTTVEFALKSVIMDCITVQNLYDEKGFDNIPVIITETGAPRQPSGTIFGSDEYQKAFTKAMLEKAKSVNILLVTFFELADNDAATEYGKMGMFKLWGKTSAEITPAGSGFKIFAVPVKEVMIPRKEVMERLDWLDEKINELLQSPITVLDDKIRVLQSASTDWKKGMEERV